MVAPSQINVGVAQISSEIGNINANVEKHLHWIDQARTAGIELLVFPETSLSGHHGGEHLLEAAMWKDCSQLEKIATAAGDMRVVVGFIEEAPGAQFYNSSAVFHAGKLEHLHRKINIPNYGGLDEGKYYARGRTVDAFQINRYWCASTLICADLWNPALTHLAFLHGATMLISPVSSAIEAVGGNFDNPSRWDQAIRFYAMMYGAPVIVANRCGKEKDLTFWGGSRIVDPFGNLIADAGKEEALISAEIDFEMVRKARALLPTVRDSNPALVLNETRRLVEKLNTPKIDR